MAVETVKFVFERKSINEYIINLSKRLGYFHVMKSLYNKEDVIDVTDIYLQTKKLLHFYKYRIIFLCNMAIYKKKTIERYFKRVETK